MSNGARRPGQRVVEEEEEDEDEVLRVDAVNGEDSMQLIQERDSPPPVEDSPRPDLGGESEEVEEEVRPKPKPRGRPRGRPAKKAPPKQKEPSPELEEAEVEQEEPPVEEEDDEDEVPAQPRRKPGRPPKKAAPAAAATKRRERASPEADDPEPEGRGKKRQKTQAKAPAPKKPAPKPKAKPKPKARQEPDPDTSLMQVQRGPPLPRARGLVSMRPDAGGQQTRSGRRSYKPLEYWKGERVEYETADVREDMFRAGSRMVLPSIKEVYRVEEEEAQARRRPRGRGKAKSSKRRAEPVEEPEEELEEWEVDPGAVSGDVILWDPDHEVNPPGADEHVEVAEDRLAISSEAIQTHDIHDGTFRFAKTLNLSFMGSGVVDLPPGAEKRPKNSRKMQMVFFVFRGKVLVSVNETEFRISAGGQWFVPRGEFGPCSFPSFGCSILSWTDGGTTGNYYSIKNDSDRPARIFFAQACEVAAWPEEE